MLGRKVDTQQMIEHVFDFGKTLEHQFPKDSGGSELLARLGQAVSQMSAHAAGQLSGSGVLQASNSSRAKAYQALLQKLERIDQTARAMELESFFVPRNQSAKALINMGETWSKDAETWKAEFIRHGLPASFIEDLRSATENLKAAIQAQAQGKSQRKGSEAGFNATLDQALADLKRFEAFVMNTFGNDAQIMAEWSLARRVGRPPARRKAAKETQPVKDAQPETVTAAGAA